MQSRVPHLMTFSSQFLARAVNILIAINVLIFFIDSQTRSGLDNLFALHFAQNDHYEIWQYVTHMFMHGNLMHLGFNMFALWMFGGALESVLGKFRFFIFYFASGIGAAVIYNLINYYQFDQIYNLLAESGIHSSEITQMIKQYSYPPSVLNEEQASKL